MHNQACVKLCLLKAILRLRLTLAVVLPPINALKWRALAPSVDKDHDPNHTKDVDKVIWLTKSFGDVFQLKQTIIRSVAILTIVLGAPLFAGLGALGQGIVKSQHGDWQMSCDTPPGASFEQCAIIQNVSAEDQPNVGLSVIVLKTADRQARLLRILAPLGVLLPNGLGLNIDGKDMGRVAFVRCLPNGCVAEVIMDDLLLDTLSKGQEAIFVVFRTPEEGIGIPVSLSGFGEGFAALP